MSKTRQDGQLLWSGLLAAPLELLASMLALLEETNFLNVLGKKGLSLINREGDEFTKALEARTLELSELDHAGVILQVLNELEEISEIQPGYLAGPRDFQDLCSELASRAVELKREGDKEFDGESLLELMSWVMQEVLGQIEDRFEQLDKEKQRAVIQRLKDFVNSLPEEQQRAIKDSLEVDQLTADVIRQAVIKGTLGVGFGAAVSIGGFAFYTGASSLLAGLTGLVGLTLPFAVYTTMSSAIAVIASPIAIIFIILGALAAGWWKGSQRIKQTLFPLVIVQLAAAAKLTEPSETRWELEEGVLTRWRGGVGRVLKCQQALDQANDQRRACEKERKAARTEVRRLEKERRSAQGVIKAGWRDLKTLALQEPETIYHESSKAAEELVEVIRKGGPELVLENPDANDVLVGIREAEAEILSAELALEVVKARVEQLTEELDAIRAVGVDRQRELEAAESRYFGLAQSASDWPDVANLPLPGAIADDRLARALARPLVAASEEERFRSVLQGSRGDHAFAGLVVGDFLYDYLRIDPLVMEGIDFARAADLSNPLLFAEFADKQAALMARGEGDSLDRLQGYVAERVAAQHLAAEGHEVSFPEHSNQAGWDLLVDGQPFQVKCTESAELIREHLERYPDIPVIVNLEHAEAFADVPQVYAEPALSVGEIRAMTQAGIHDGAEVVDFELPWIALAVATAVELRDLYRHRTGYKEALTNITTSTAGRAAGGGLGAAAGSVLGSFLFGPAGSVVGGLSGAIGGGIGGGRLVRAARGLLVSDEAEAVRAAARNLAAQAAAEVPGKLLVWDAKKDRIAQLQIPEGDGTTDVYLLRDWLLQRMHADAAYFKQRKLELERVAAADDKPDPRELLRLTLDLVRRAAIHPHRLQAAYRDLFQAVKAWRTASAKFRISNAEPLT